ncbi:hypothetical protein SAMN04489832_0620 [Micromonospora cremea]|uniref:Uncharacterized protein n=1 Tax=Micromonospora cremea TaxID=709881 RepID=A0A1N5U528_9ACTN|nr:hypothetical protein SAMN04489832_0620 [Micromonospora cremea]
MSLVPVNREPVMAHRSMVTPVRAAPEKSVRVMSQP